MSTAIIRYISSPAQFYFLDVYIRKNVEFKDAGKLDVSGNVGFNCYYIRIRIIKKTHITVSSLIENKTKESMDLEINLD